MQDHGSAGFSPHSFTIESGRGQALTSERKVLGKTIVMLHKWNVRENKGLLKKEYLFLAQFSHNIPPQFQILALSLRLLNQAVQTTPLSPPSIFGQWIPIPNLFLLLGPTVYLWFSFSYVLAFFWVTLKNSLFTLSRFQQGCFWDLPSLTSTWGSHYWRIHFLWFWMEYVQPGVKMMHTLFWSQAGDVKGQNMCSHSVWMNSIFSAPLQQPWETFTAP